MIFPSFELGIGHCLGLVSYNDTSGWLEELEVFFYYDWMPLEHLQNERLEPKKKHHPIEKEPPNLFKASIFFGFHVFLFQGVEH